MFFALNHNFILRGWTDLPYMLVDIKNNRVKPLDELTFRTLKLFDSQHDLSDEKYEPVIKTFLKLGLIHQCENGQDFNNFQAYKKFNNRYISMAHWSITGKCNFKCKHCFMSAPDVNAFEFSHEKISQIIQQLDDCGIMNVSLTGGEPLVRRDFVKILDELREHNINISRIYTNGALVNKNLLNELFARDFRPEFYFSFDGVGWHDWLRGIPGAELLTDNAMKLCADSGLIVHASMSMHDKNKFSLRDTINHLAKIGVKILKLGHISELGNWKENNFKSLSAKEFYQICLDYIPFYYQDNMPLEVNLAPLFSASPSQPDKFFIPGYTESYEPENQLLCLNSKRSIYIAPDGRILTCMLMCGMNIQEKFPSITQKSLAECLEDNFYLNFANMTAKDFHEANHECRDCKFSKHCYGGCRIGALTADENNMMAKSPDLCEFFFGEWPQKVIDTVRKVRPDINIS